VQEKQQLLKQLAAEVEARKTKGSTGPTGQAAPQQQQQQQAKQQPALQQQAVQQQAQLTDGLQQQQQQPSPPASLTDSLGIMMAPAAGGVQGGGSAGGMMRVLEGTAQEVYRSLLFVVFTVEVYCLSLIPFAGERRMRKLDQPEQLICLSFVAETRVDD
jgi:hypothetical protein